MRKNFDIKWFASTKVDLNRSVIGWIKNQFAKAIAEEKLFPKLMILIPNCDMINNLVTEKFGVSEIYSRIIHWLAAEINKFVEIHKEGLPTKSVKADYPSFVWIPPAQNVNFANNALRNKFAKSLKTSLEVLPNHMMLKLIKLWDYGDTSLAKDDAYTVLGYKQFWQSLDSVIHFWCSTLALGAHPMKPAIESHNKNCSNFHHNGDNSGAMYSGNRFKPNDRFHWVTGSRQRKLPMPPPEKRLKHYH